MDIFFAFFTIVMLVILAALLFFLAYMGYHTIRDVVRDMREENRLEEARVIRAAKEAPVREWDAEFHRLAHMARR